MGNKVRFGLEQVHVAFKGVAQTQSIEVTEPPSTDGEVTLTITANTLLGNDSPHDVVVPLASETHTTTAKVASAIVNALNNDEVISAVFMARRVGAAVYLATKVVQDNDATLAIAADTGATGAEMGDSTVVAAGTVGWGTPVAIPGVVNFSATPDGGENAFYADNTKYYVRQTNNGYTGELEMALIPDAILAEMLGWEIDDNGMLVENADGVAKEFALAAQVQGDAKNRRFVYYRCAASRPAQASATTTDSITPTTEKLSLTILPLEVGGKRIVKAVIELSETNQAAYDAFFDAVTLPVAGGE